MPFRWFPASAAAQLDLLDIERIVAAAERIFRTVPWTIDGPEEFMDQLRQFGCEVEGRKVRFTAGAADQTLQLIREYREKNKAKQMAAGEKKAAAPQVTAFTHGQAMWCADPITNTLRPATKKDLAEWCRVVNNIPEIVDRTHPTFLPQDAPPGTREFHAFVTILLNSDKPYRVSAYSKAILKYWVEALTIYYGTRAKAIENIGCPAKVWVNTPFTICREVIEAAMELRRLTGKPLAIGSIPCAGIATPVTPAGALALTTAEVLGMNAIALAVDGKVLGWSASPICFDFKSGIHTEWGPETILLQTAVSHIAAYLFGTSPRVQATSMVAAQVPGEQSMAERAFGFGMAFLCGVRRFGVGCLAFSDVASLVQLMLDMELVSAMNKLAEGFTVDAETLAEELIKEVAPKGADFAATDHTLRHFRQVQWFPELMDRRLATAYMKDPLTMLERAKSKALHLRDKAPNLCPLDEEQKEELTKLLAVADRELG